MRRGFALLVGLGLAAGVWAEEPPAADEPLAVAQELGRINGLALACHYADVVARVKQIMIQRVPKSRRYGDAFETATSAAFTAPEDCPDAAALNVRAELAAGRLPAAQPEAK